MAVTKASPKARFLEQSVFAEQHRDLVDRSAFEIASDAAMLQMIHDTQDTSDPTAAAAAFHRIMGAKSYLSRLKTIGDTVEPVAPKATGSNLATNQ